MSAKILVIDDELGARKTIENLLFGEDYEVQFACDGSEGLALAQAWLPDVIVSDVMMPGLDGFELCQQLRADTRLEQVPVILLTALDDRQAKLTGLQAGADEFLTKPIDAVELRARLRTLTRLDRFRKLNAEHLKLEEAYRDLLQAHAALRASEDNYRALAADLEGRVKERTQELSTANARLTELDRLKDKFIADVTHELRTPVTSLSLYIDLLEHGKPAKREFYVTKLSEQMARLHKSINDILDMSRLERDLVTTGRSVIDLNSIVEHVTVMEQAAADAAGLSLTCTVDAAAPQVLARPDQLTRAITNLIANAIQYAPRGSVHVRTYVRMKRVAVEVTDTGRGIPADELPHLFERFYRGQEVAQSNIPGTGLGLAIVKEIIEAHGGSVEVASQSGVGSTFRIWLPSV